MPSDEVLREELGLQRNFAGGMETRVRPDFDEVVGVGMLEELNKVGVEHEGAFEYADDYEFQSALLLLDLVVVFVNLLCQFGDSLLDGLLVVEKCKLQSFMELC